jgi:hypothetical protein
MLLPSNSSGPQSPSYGLSQFAHCFPILHRQLYDKCTLIPSPNIACDAASQPITTMIYLNERRTAAVAATGHCSHLIDENSSTSLFESQSAFSEIE